jgi:hypothetical protein
MKLKIIFAIFAIAAALMWQARAQTYDTNNVVVQTRSGPQCLDHQTQKLS